MHTWALRFSQAANPYVCVDVMLCAVLSFTTEFERLVGSLADSAAGCYVASGEVCKCTAKRGEEGGRGGGGRGSGGFLIPVVRYPPHPIASCDCPRLTTPHSLLRCGQAPLVATAKIGVGVWLSIPAIATTWISQILIAVHAATIEVDKSTTTLEDLSSVAKSATTA